MVRSRPKFHCVELYINGGIVGLSTIRKSLLSPGVSTTGLLVMLITRRDKNDGTILIQYLLPKNCQLCLFIKGENGNKCVTLSGIIILKLRHFTIPNTLQSLYYLNSNDIMEDCEW